MTYDGNTVMYAKNVRYLISDTYLLCGVVGGAKEKNEVGGVGRDIQK